jgi:opacity protein-like surface antigen
LSIGLRFNGTSLDGQKLGLENVENPAMGGMGVQLRTKTSDKWGLELSADFLTGNDTTKDYTQSTVPVMLSALYYPFPNSAIKPYALAGAGVHFTNLNYKSGMFEHHILELAGQLGGGVELQVGDSILLHADLRFLTVYKNLGSVNYVSEQCIQSKASGIKGFCNGLEALDTNDKFNIGAQFQAGVSFFF